MIATERSDRMVVMQKLARTVSAAANPRRSIQDIYHFRSQFPLIEILTRIALAY
jgi:hypothetical protein